ncbi:MAG: cell division protein ZapA [Gemmatimonadota bacterium]|nr:cell division protein ZapA [Gemmatimonadota bacterium]
MSEDRRKIVKVKIGADEYALKSDRTEDYTKAVADHVDDALKEVLKTGSIVETHKAAILAALAITDDLFQARLATRQLERRISVLTGQLTRLLPPDKRPELSSDQFASTADEH